MDFENKYNLAVDENAVVKTVEKIKGQLNSGVSDKALLATCFSLIDLTTLNSTDSIERGKLFAQRVSDFSEKFPGLPNVAAICVYPSLVASVRQSLTANNVKIASVAAGFPSSQTFINIKLSECEMCLEMGADEFLQAGDALDDGGHGPSMARRI